MRTGGMETEKYVRLVSLLLASVAGFCDTATFVAADELFSAHVTGNFIVLANDVVQATDGQAWLKLLTFPVFLVAVMMGGWLAKQSPDKHLLLMAEGLLLLLCGTIALVVDRRDASFPWLVKLIPMLVVVAMGFQNTFGRLFSKETYGPTTVMTGNVTQAALDLAGLFTARFADGTKWESFKKQVLVILGFLFGCLLGAIAASQAGLRVVLLPGLALILLFLNQPLTYRND